jgi:PAS domain S-box-containing protein
MAVFSADLRGEFIACNSAFNELLGYSLLEVLGRDFSALFAETEKSDGGNHEGLRRTILAATSTEGDYRGNLFAQPKTGKSFPVKFSATVLRESSGKSVALVAVIVPASETRGEASVTAGKAAASRVKRSPRRRARNRPRRTGCNVGCRGMICAKSRASWEN